MGLAWAIFLAIKIIFFHDVITDDINNRRQMIITHDAKWVIILRTLGGDANGVGGEVLNRGGIKKWELNIDKYFIYKKHKLIFNKLCFYLFRCIQHFLCIKYSDNDDLKKNSSFIYVLKRLNYSGRKSRVFKRHKLIFSNYQTTKVSIVKNVENLHFLRILLILFVKYFLKNAWFFTSLLRVTINPIC